MITLYHGDCLSVLPTLAAGSVDAVIADPPYGTTACAWDTVIPFEPMWRELKRVIRPRGAIVLFGSQPFTSALVMSNPKWFRYEWVWNKVLPAGFLNTKLQPLNCHESVVVFGSGTLTYNPQMSPRADVRLVRYDTARTYGNGEQSTYGKRERMGGEYTHRFPISIITQSNANRGGLHPTQKPLALLEYLVKTYTNAGDTVLDFTMGSGTTGEACVNLDRSFIGIEKHRPYYDIAARRIAEAAARPRQATLDLDPAPQVEATMEVLL